MHSAALRDKIRECSTPEPNTGCWLWERSCQSTGYGKLCHSRGTYLAHRASYTAFHGEVPPGMFVCHKCDVKSCVNPDHLFLGTHADNMRDMAAKGRASRAVFLESRPRGDNHYSRQTPERLARGERNGARQHPERRPRGERHGLSKLTESAVRDIRSRAVAGETCAQLARAYGVSVTPVWQVVKGKTWRHVA
jgi:hypothetical protein